MVEIISKLHFLNMVLVLATGTITGIWGLLLFFLKKTQTLYKPWRISLIITAIIGALQAVFGIILVLLGQRPGTGTGSYYLHYVYGAIVVVALPVALTYATSNKNPRRDVLIYSIAALILAVVGGRAAMTGLGLP